jgi:hypothetical protein
VSGWLTNILGRTGAISAAGHLRPLEECAQQRTAGAAKAAMMKSFEVAGRLMSSRALRRHSALTAT